MIRNSCKSTHWWRLSHHWRHHWLWIMHFHHLWHHHRWWHLVTNWIWWVVSSTWSLQAFCFWMWSMTSFFATVPTATLSSRTKIVLLVHVTPALMILLGSHEVLSKLDTLYLPVSFESSFTMTLRSLMSYLHVWRSKLSEIFVAPRR